MFTNLVTALVSLFAVKAAGYGPLDTVNALREGIRVPGVIPVYSPDGGSFESPEAFADYLRDAVSNPTNSAEYAIRDLYRTLDIYSARTDDEGVFLPFIADGETYSLAPEGAAMLALIATSSGN